MEQRANNINIPRWHRRQPNLDRFFHHRLPIKTIKIKRFDKTSTGRVGVRCKRV